LLQKAAQISFTNIKENAQEQIVYFGNENKVVQDGMLL